MKTKSGTTISSKAGRKTSKQIEGQKQVRSALKFLETRCGIDTSRGFESMPRNTIGKPVSGGATTFSSQAKILDLDDVVFVAFETAIIPQHPRLKHDIGIASLDSRDLKTVLNASDCGTPQPSMIKGIHYVTKKKSNTKLRIQHGKRCFDGSWTIETADVGYFLNDYFQSNAFSARRNIILVYYNTTSYCKKFSFDLSKLHNIIHFVDVQSLASLKDSCERLRWKQLYRLFTTDPKPTSNAAHKAIQTLEIFMGLLTNSSHEKGKQTPKPAMLVSPPPTLARFLNPGAYQNPLVTASADASLVVTSSVSPAPAESQSLAVDQLLPSAPTISSSGPETRLEVAVQPTFPSHLPESDGVSQKHANGPTAIKEAGTHTLHHQDRRTEVLMVSQAVKRPRYETSDSEDLAIKRLRRGSWSPLLPITSITPRMLSIPLHKRESSDVAESEDGNTSKSHLVLRSPSEYYGEAIRSLMCFN